MYPCEPAAGMDILRLRKQYGTQLALKGGIDKFSLRGTKEDIRCELEKKLNSHFFRAGRSALVNLKKISRVTKKEIYLQDGSIIPLPRGAYEKVNRAIINMD